MGRRFGERNLRQDQHPGQPAPEREVGEPAAAAVVERERPLPRLEFDQKFARRQLTRNHDPAFEREPPAADPEQRDDLAVERAQFFDGRQRFGAAVVQVDVDAVVGRNRCGAKRKRRHEQQQRNNSLQIPEKHQLRDLFFKVDDAIL